MRRAPLKSKPQRGFSLLEVLVAFAILALSMGIIFQSYSTGMRGIALSKEYAMAVELAESQQAQVGTLIALEPGTTEGLWDERFQWEVVITPQEEEGSDTYDFELYRITSRVSWQEGGSSRSFELDSMKVAKRAP